MEPLKTGADAGSVGAWIVALTNWLNPLLELVLVVLSIAWLVYRFLTRKNAK